jgi:hypothetical protein
MARARPTRSTLVDGDVIDVDAAFREELLNVSYEIP